jgi:hypothetical protein
MVQEEDAVTGQRRPQDGSESINDRGIFHMQHQLHAKESGDAHESSRIWRIPGYCARSRERNRHAFIGCGAE